MVLAAETAGLLTEGDKTFLKEVLKLPAAIKDLEKTIGIDYITLPARQGYWDMSNEVIFKTVRMENVPAAQIGKARKALEHLKQDISPDLDNNEPDPVSHFQYKFQPKNHHYYDVVLQLSGDKHKALQELAL